MAMATAVANEEMSNCLLWITWPRRSLPTAEAHVATLTGTFLDKFLAGAMGDGNQTSDEMISELGKYQREAIVSPQLQSDVYSHFTDLHVCSDVANSIGQHVALTVAQEREKYRRQMLAVEYIHTVCLATTAKMNETSNSTGRGDMV